MRAEGEAKATIDLADSPFAGATLTMRLIARDAANNEGNLWIIWQEAATFGTFSTTGSDNCNTATVALGLTPPPRCVYLPFKL